MITVVVLNRLKSEKNYNNNDEWREIKKKKSFSKPMRPVGNKLKISGIQFY